MKEKFRRRHLPHWDPPGATFFITACLQGSIPAQGLLAIQNLVRSLREQPRPPGMTPDAWRIHNSKRVFALRDEWLDLRPQVRHLEDARLAAEVQSALYHFADERYDLLAYVIMPSHLHWVFRPREKWVASLEAAETIRTPRERIMHSLQRYTGLQCNALLNRKGKFWQPESYDHVVRNEEELQRIVDYVELNPVKRGWVENREQWRFSSAFDRTLVQPEELSRSLSRDLLLRVRGTN
jgi:type I restriction enzyme R subunit